jgi:hydrogenase nickel incorporation protein HypA/HybF
MHETGIVRDLLRKVEQACLEAGAAKVSRVTVRLGALSQFSPAHFREHFDEEARGTLAEGAALGIEISDDLRDPNAQSVMIRNLELEVPDEGA